MSEFERIKKAVDTQRNRKAQGEAREQALTEEEARILKSVAEATEQVVPDHGTVNVLAEQYRSDIENDILKMKNVLEQEGVTY